MISGDLNGMKNKIKISVLENIFVLRPVATSTSSGSGLSTKKLTSTLNDTGYY
jgi:hypothetical protein